MLKHYDLTIPVLLFAIGLAAVSLYGDAGDFALTVLALLALYSLLADASSPASAAARPTFGANARSIAAATLGTIAALFVLAEPPVFARALPVLLLLGYWLSTEGAHAPRRRWRELLIVGLLAIPDRLLMSALTSPLLHLFGWDSMIGPSAELATAFVAYSGLPATLNGADITTARAIVTILPACDASRNIDFLLKIALMLILTLPVRPLRWLPTVLVAMLCAFVVNAVRLALLVHLAHAGDLTGFDYWHDGDGSKLFNLAAIAIFALFAYFQIDTASPEAEPTRSDDAHRRGSPGGDTGDAASGRG
jgi:exosortase/archaeosortase family protein